MAWAAHNRHIDMVPIPVILHLDATRPCDYMPLYLEAVSQRRDLGVDQPQLYRW
jgi:hypothetical protein